MREIISIILSVMLVAFGVATLATSETVNPSMNFVYADSVKANVAIYRSTAITSTSCATSANPLTSADILTDESFVEEGAEQPSTEDPDARVVGWTIDSLMI